MELLFKLLSFSKMKLVLHFLVLFILFNDVYGFNTTSEDGRKHYIVYMGSHSFPNSESLISSNHDLLSSIMGSLEAAKGATVYHYHKSFRGFSAMLTPRQAHKISKNENVVSVLENTFGHLDTMRSWDFIGADDNSLYTSVSNLKGYDVIVGHFDSGIWPLSPSFQDKGLGPVPSRWKGSCIGPDCSRKVIGNRWYSAGFVQEYGPIESYAQGQTYYLSARDDYGHGTHTASIAVGSVIKNVQPKGMSKHDVRGGAPGARLAVYKVCWFNICSCADVLKAYDDAIADGVDIITISAGSKVKNNQPSFMNDCFAVGSLHAFQRGILVSSSAGNYGDAGTVENAAPWMLTVGASTIDREFFAPLQLGNSVTLRGQGFNGHDMSRYHDIVYARSAARRGFSEERASTCEEENALDREVISGKIVVCTMKNWEDDKQVKANVVQSRGGIGMVVIDPRRMQAMTMDHSIPTTVINDKDAIKLDAYMRNADYPRAIIHPHKSQINVKSAPKIAEFSSRGPGSAPDIIKPDIVAPGVNILASWPAWNQKDESARWFQIESGTSMACPHATGVAALLKATHRDWSPAAIKSALMTTASQLDNIRTPIRLGRNKATPFDMGSGNLNPSDALTPALVYDYDTNDLMAYLCNNANQRQLQNIFGNKLRCPSSPVPAYNLNYPSISISSLQHEVVVKRKVTFVGDNSEHTQFHVKIENPEGVSLQVEPSVLEFYGDKRTATYKVKVRAWQRAGRHGKHVFGSITWLNDINSVRSPVSVRLV